MDAPEDGTGKPELLTKAKGLWGIKWGMGPPAGW
jgi:hypothetical protein